MSNLLFFGSDNFPVPIFEKLLQSPKFRICGLVTSPYIPKDSRNLLATIARKNNIPVFHPQDVNKEARKILEKLQPDIILVCNYGQMLNKYILEYPEFSCLNIHCSLLPQLRGACPIESAIILGLSKTGVSIQIMTGGMDTGDILFQQGISIDQDATGGSLRQKLQTLATENIEQVIRDWINRKIIPQPQDASQATYCYRKNISRNAAQINWKEKASAIEKKIRAFNPKPTAWTFVQVQQKKKRLKIFQAETTNRNLHLPHGKAVIEKNKLLIQTSKGIITPKVVQLEGKSQMQIKQFLCGFKGEISLL